MINFPWSLSSKYSLNRQSAVLVTMSYAVLFACAGLLHASAPMWAFKPDLKDPFTLVPKIYSYLWTNWGFCLASWSLHGWTSMSRVNQMGPASTSAAVFPYIELENWDLGLHVLTTRVWSILLRTEPKFTSLWEINFHDFDSIKLILLIFRMTKD